MCVYHPDGIVRRRCSDGRVYGSRSALLAFPRLRDLMEGIGFDNIINIGPGGGAFLCRAVSAIDRVRWDLVDPFGKTVPRYAFRGTPVFAGGDAVSWDAHHRCLDVVHALLLRPSESESRGRRLTGDLVAQGRRHGSGGYGIRMQSWAGVPLH